MKPTVALAAAFIFARAGSAAQPSTPPLPPGRRIGGPVRRALNVAAVVILAACGGDGDPTQAGTDGSIRGTVTDNTGATVANAAVALTGNAQAARTTNSGADGVYTFADVPPGTYALAVTPPAGFSIGAAGTASVTVARGAQADASAFVLYRVAVEPGQWGLRAPLIEANSELALAESNGKLYLLGGYPASRQTARTVQVYDIASDRWALGPQLPQPNNHGMAAAVNGKIYLIGGQLTADQEGYVDTAYELDPATGAWVEKARMPTARSGGVAVVHGGKIYVAGGRVPRGSDFAVYDPAADRWEVLPDLPTQRNHITGAAINGRIHILGGRLGNGLSPLKTTAHEVFDPQTRTWTTAAPMLSGRSGINGVMARGCFHVWGGEAPTGMTPQHEYYDPRTNQWSSLPNMPLPVHGVVGSAFVDGLIWATGGGTQIGGSFGSLLNQVYRPAVSCE
jgi:N-acetylneuraminic acid mutarotase